MEEDKRFKTRELEAAGRPGDYSVWFRLPDNSRLTIEMSLGGLLRLQGLVNRAVADLTGMSPDEVNGYASTEVGASEGG